MTQVLIYISFPLLLLGYFFIAKHYKIIDLPNDRSSHDQATVRGAGIIFPLAMVIGFLYSSPTPWLIITGLLLLSIISLIDDIMGLANRVRVFVQLFSTVMLVLSLQVDVLFGLILIIVITGFLNSYNFMDGINGITGAYSLVFVGTMIVVGNIGQTTEANEMLSVALLTFLFFNFRNKAKCFSGDVGSITLGYFVAYSLLSLILTTGRLEYVLFVVIYGIDSVITILTRLVKGENIFRAHRKHLYQLLKNELKSNALVVSSSYALLQLIINIGTIFFVDATVTSSFQFIIFVCLGLIFFYSVLRHMVLKRIEQNDIATS